MVSFPTGPFHETSATPSLIKPHESIASYEQYKHKRPAKSKFSAPTETPPSRTSDISTFGGPWRLSWRRYRHLDGNHARILLRGHRGLRWGCVGGPCRVDCAPRGVQTASDAFGHPKSASGNHESTSWSLLRSERKCGGLGRIARNLCSCPDLSRTVPMIHSATKV